MTCIEIEKKAQDRAVWRDIVDSLVTQRNKEEEEEQEEQEQEREQEV